MKTKPFKILLAGGGSGGPVAPLLAVKKHIEQTHPELKVHWLLVGTKKGVERRMAENAHVNFSSIPVAKLHRYWSPKNLILPFAFIFALLASFRLVHKFRPSVVMGAGGFSQVPIIILSKFFGAKILIHQQDITPSLSNVICSFFADKITVSFKISEQAFYDSFFISGLKQKSKTIYTGNPTMLSDELPTRKQALKFFNFEDSLPVFLFFGGATGSDKLNSLVKESLTELLKIGQVIHIHGSARSDKKQLSDSAGYRSYSFLSEMSMAYAAADIVVARAGLSTISELSKFEKVSILIPMPNTHQEANAEWLSFKKSAVVLMQKNLKSAQLVKIIRKLGFSAKLQEMLRQNIKKIMPQEATANVADQLLELISHK